MQFNSVTLLGNLVNDPKTKNITDDRSVCEFRLAVNSDKEKDKVLYIDIDAWGGLGQTVQQYKKKGDPVLVHGRIAYSEWMGCDNKPHSKHHIIAEDVIFLQRNS